MASTHELEVGDTLPLAHNRVFIINSSPEIFNMAGCALAGVARWIEHRLVNQRVTGSIPGPGTCLGSEPGPQ